MRSLFVLLLLLALIGLVRGSSVGVLDADDQALMEIGVDLTHRVEPTPTYTSVKPAGHEDVLMAKFPLLHEIQGVEAKDWTDIQGLLFREPPSAAESNVDMKLDELEAKFNKIDTMPVPSSIAPKGSTLLPSLKKEEIGLRATLPPSLAPRLKQVQKPKVAAAAPAKSAAAPAAAAPAPAPAKPATPTPAPAAAATPAVKPAAPATPAPAAPVSVDVVKANDEAAKKSAKRVEDTIVTVRLIEKRIKGLNTLMQRLKTQIGIQAADKTSSAKRLTDALAKHRKEKEELAKRMAARKASFMEVHQETETETETEHETEGEVDVASDIAAVLNGESEVESEQGADADAEVEADAEAVDSIIDSLM